MSSAPSGISRRWGVLSLLVGTLLFAASFSVVKRLMELGSEHLVDGRNPISFCNVLFAGNIVAGLTFYFIFFQQCTPQRCRKIPSRHWFLLLLIAFLEGAAAPALVFVALSEISVARVVLVQSIQTPLVLIVAWWLFGETASRLSVAGALIALAGIMVMVGLQAVLNTMGESKASLLGWSEARVALASLLFVLATQLRRPLSRDLPLGIYAVMRTLAGSAFFAVIVLALFGPEHFVDVLDPFLWKWMLIYGALIVVLGQLAWHLGLQSSTSTDICVAEAATPVLGILFAFLILNQIPTAAEFLGGAIIIGGIGLTVWGHNKAPKPSVSEKARADNKSGPFNGI